MQTAGNSQLLIAFSDWTTSQRELWALVSLESNGAALNTGQFTELFGAIDTAAFMEASRQALEECEALRVRIHERDDGPQQWIAPLDQWTPACIDLSREADPRMSALDWMQRELARPFEPQAAMFSWALIKLAREHFIWCFIVHQLVLDGYGRNIVSRRLSELYSNLVGMPLAESSPPGRLNDLLAEDAAYRHSENYEGSRRYWATQTAELPRPTRITTKSSQGSYVGVRHAAPLPAATTASVRQLMADTKVSLSGLFAAASATYLHRLGGNRDVVVGLLVSARTTSPAHGVPGNVSNTVPLRIKFRPGMTLESLIVQVRARVREALKHQRFPLSEMKAAIPSLSGEIFSIAINVMKFDYALKFGHAGSASHNLSNGPVDDLSISIFEQPGDDGLHIALNGNVNRYSIDELKAHYDRFGHFLDRFCHSDLSTTIEEAPFFKNVEPLGSISQPASSILVRDTSPNPTASPPSEEYVGPQSPREESLCRLFGEILGAGCVSANDDFFHIGGHSLLAARLVSRLNFEYGIKLPLRTVFEHSTPRSLAGFLDAKEQKAGEKSTKPVLLLFPGGGVITREVINLRKELATDFTVALIDYPDWRSQFEILFDIDKYLAAVTAQIQQAAPTPRPLHLIGYSFGAGVAYVMANRLARLGYSIEFVGIIDGRSPVMPNVEVLASAKTFTTRFSEFLVRERSSRNYQLGRFIGIRAKQPIYRKLLQWLGPFMPSDQSSQFLFYMTSFINASLPMGAISEWTHNLGKSERQLTAPTVLFRSTENGNGWPEDLGWRELIPGLEIMHVPGNHFTVIGDANLPAIRSRITAGSSSSAAQLNDALSRLQVAATAMAGQTSLATTTDTKNTIRKNAA